MSTETPHDATQGDHLGSALGALVHRIQRPDFPGNDRAAFKRWAPGQPPPLGFYRLFLQSAGGETPPPAQTEAWMLMCWALCNCISHQPGRPLGRALAESGYAEARLERLLSADPDLLPELASALLRFLAAKGETCNLLQLLSLLLARDPERRETIHRRIASDYFRHLSRTTTE